MELRGDKEGVLGLGAQLDDLHAGAGVIAAHEAQAGGLQLVHQVRVHLVPVPVPLVNELLRLRQPAILGLRAAMQQARHQHGLLWILAAQ